MKIEIRTDGPEFALRNSAGISYEPPNLEISFNSEAVRTIGEEYVMRAVVINCAGVISPVESEERARYLAEEAHAGAGWSWGILLQKRMPRVTIPYKEKSNGL